MDNGYLVMRDRARELSFVATAVEDYVFDAREFLGSTSPIFTVLRFVWLSKLMVAPMIPLNSASETTGETLLYAKTASGYYVLKTPM